MADKKKIKIMWLTAVIGFILSCLLALLQNVKHEGYISQDNPINQRHVGRMILRDLDIEQNDPFGVLRIYLSNGIYSVAWYRFRLYAGDFHNPLSAFMLANLYKDGNGVPESPQLAKFWAKQAMSWAKEHNETVVYTNAEKLLEILKRKK